MSTRSTILCKPTIDVLEDRSLPSNFSPALLNWLVHHHSRTWLALHHLLPAASLAHSVHHPVPLVRPVIHHFHPVVFTNAFFTGPILFGPEDFGFTFVPFDTGFIGPPLDFPVAFSSDFSTFDAGGCPCGDSFDFGGFDGGDF
jgi:hypothetical protein